MLRSTLDRNLSWATQKGIVLRLDADQPCMVHADRARLEPVVDKLVDNAIKYSPVGSTILLRCQAVGDRAQIDVVDKGPGLCADDRARVFQSYARLSARPTAGEISSGLGLAIAREIVELHGGSIGMFNNDPAPGATFWISLKRTA
ncbi:MAG: HAMP domain-containing histidine kinase [Oligoflexia bacterium]|nr:HAMP domain-containing histidine kinase [Oligoflexia bacterium]